MKFRRERGLENGWVIQEKQRCSKQRNNRHLEGQRQVGEPVLVRHQSAVRYPCMARTPRGECLSPARAQCMSEECMNNWMNEWTESRQFNRSSQVEQSLAQKYGGQAWMAKMSHWEWQFHLDGNAEGHLFFRMRGERSSNFFSSW